MGMSYLTLITSNVDQYMCIWGQGTVALKIVIKFLLLVRQTSFLWMCKCMGFKEVEGTVSL